jgi:pimeloyl-ACP methyl ester carboxylesterase
MTLPTTYESFFTSNDARLHYIHWPGIGKPLALLAGLGDNANIFNGIALKLTDRFNVFALTRRGHGRSERPDTGYDLDTLVQDIYRFLDHIGINRPILVGHSFGGIEAACFAAKYPHHVEAIVYLDALFPELNPEPNLSGDPIWSVVPTKGPTEADLASRQAYLAYYKRRRPDWARIWQSAIEADLMDRVTRLDDGSLKFHHDDALMNRILGSLFPPYPRYDLIDVPQLAIVPGGDFHPSAPLDTSGELRHAADGFWFEKLQPWIRQRTATFQHMSPAAKIVEFDAPYHHVFLSKEDETVRTICDFLVHKNPSTSLTPPGDEK